MPIDHVAATRAARQNVRDAITSTILDPARALPVWLAVQQLERAVRAQCRHESAQPLPGAGREVE